MVKKDWHIADIVSALRKSGISVSALSRKAGFASSTLNSVFYSPWAKGELIIADRLGLKPSEIWPSRYFDSNGNIIDRKRKNKQRSFHKNK